jgi:hypothetical protein
MQLCSRGGRRREGSLRTKLRMAGHAGARAGEAQAEAQAVKTSASMKEVLAAAEDLCRAPQTTRG